jgi:hypothetical protein
MIIGPFLEHAVGEKGARSSLPTDGAALVLLGDPKLSLDPDYADKLLFVPSGRHIPKRSMPCTPKKPTLARERNRNGPRRAYNPQNLSPLPDILGKQPMNFVHSSLNLQDMIGAYSLEYLLQRTSKNTVYLSCACGSQAISTASEEQEMPRKRPTHGGAIANVFGAFDLSRHVE